MIRRILAAGLAALMLLAAAGCSDSDPAGSAASSLPGGSSSASSADDSTPIVLKIGSQSAAEASEVLVLKRFESLVEEASDGALDIQIFTGSSLGPLNDLISGMSLGTVEMATVGLNSFSALCEDFTVYDLWNFQGPEEFIRLYSSPVGQALNQELLESAGIRVLSYNLCGTGRMYFWGNREISTVSAYRGLQIRTNSSSACSVAIAALQALPISVSWSDMSVALQTGVIDVASGDTENMLTSGFCGQVRYRYEIPENFMGSSLCISQKVWESLSPELQQIVEEAAVEACQTYGDELYAQELQNNEAALKAAGVETLTMAPGEQEAMAGLIRDSLDNFLAGAVSPELLEQVQAVLRSPSQA